MAEINRTEVWMWDEVVGTEQESYAVYDAIESALKQHMRESVMGFQRRYRPLDSLTFALDRNTGEVILSTPEPEPLTPEEERALWLEQHGGYDAAVEWYMDSDKHSRGWYVECGHCPTVPVPHEDSHRRDQAMHNAYHHVQKEHGIEHPRILRGEG